LFAFLIATVAHAETPSTVLSPKETRQQFLKLIDRPKVDLAPQEKTLPAEGGMVQIDFSYASEAGQRVPGILLIKEELSHDGARHPVTIILHGTGGKKEGSLAVMKRMAEKGFIAVGIDGRFHGERGNLADYNAAIAKAFVDGGSHPLYYDTVWDVLRSIDYLQTRSDVDPKRIGLMGFSKGGIETWLAAAVDERIAVAIPCIALQSFRWALDHDGWHNRIGTVKKGFTAAAKSAQVENPDAAFVQRFYDRVIPGIYDRFDGPQMVTLIAPRPLLGISGDKDPINPLPGIKLCEEAAEASYTQAGVPDHFKMIIERGVGHSVNSEAHAAAVEWFVKWLKPEATTR
jgi:predicted esterase